VLIPSFGLFTLLCVACLGGSVLIAFEEGTTFGAVFLGAVVVAVPITIAGAFRFLRTSRFGQRVLLGAPDTAEAVDAIYDENTRLLGREGTAVTPLRPSGTAEFDGDRVAVVTDGDLIGAGRRIRVTEVEGNRVVVVAVDPEPEDD
jgi:membrane-bound serine protease (ClpP class)